MQEDLDMTTRKIIMETQRVDLGTYKTSLGRLENKYNDVVAELDEANNEIVETLKKPEQPFSTSERKSIASIES